ncbi:hypothetical protein ACFVSW_20250 [Neobacillus sp. NPDC058068]|uniref:hypothetical protein n=1 Tax=Neobacillus sp. NPDC058068 TaxID=3346325 RepID=UPI0036D839C7
MNIGIALGIPFISKVKKILARDTFNRADSPVLGKADTGQTWEQLYGVYEVKTKQVYAPGSSASIAGLNVGKPNYRIISDIYSTSNTTLGLAFRIVDKDTFYACRVYQMNLEIYKFNGATTLLGNFNGVGYGLKTLKIEVVGSTFKCYINNQLVLTVNDSDLANANKVGFRGAGVESYAKNIIVEEI